MGFGYSGRHTLPSGPTPPPPPFPHGELERRQRERANQQAALDAAFGAACKQLSDSGIVRPLDVLTQSQHPVPPLTSLEAGVYGTIHVAIPGGLVEVHQPGVVASRGDVISAAQALAVETTIFPKIV